MTRCWRCGGGKTITMVTTGTHVLLCPTCGGSGEKDQGSEVADLQNPEAESLATAKPAATDPLRTGTKVA